MPKVVTALLLATSLVCLVHAPAPVHAQSTVDFTGQSNIFVGFSASPPQQMAGGAITATFAELRNLGLMADFRITTDSPRNDIFLSGRSPDQADNDGDIFLRERSTWRTVGLSAVKGLTPEFAIYVGGGVTRKEVYLRYEDETRERAAPLGVYWVEDEDQSTDFANVVAGAFLRMGNRLAVQVGGQSAPRSFVLGGHFRIR
jgi:hypothetical protein